MCIRDRLGVFGEIRRSDGSTSKDWSPLLPGHTWLEEQQMFERESDQQRLTPEDAIAQADRLYMPHSYPKSHWNAIVDQIPFQTSAVLQATCVPATTETSLWTLNRPIGESRHAHSPATPRSLCVSGACGRRAEKVSSATLLSSPVRVSRVQYRFQ